MAGDFTDLLAWKEADALMGEVRVLVDRMTGPGVEQAVDQIVRASESIPANIAEAYGRGAGKDGCRFLRIAIGSATELESRVRSAVTFGRVTPAVAAPVIARVRRVRALTAGWMHWMERKINS